MSACEGAGQREHTVPCLALFENGSSRFPVLGALVQFRGDVEKYTEKCDDAHANNPPEKIAKSLRVRACV